MQPRHCLSDLTNIQSTHAVSRPVIPGPAAVSRPGISTGRFVQHHGRLGLARCQTGADAGAMAGHRITKAPPPRGLHSRGAARCKLRGELERRLRCSLPLPEPIRWRSYLWRGTRPGRETNGAAGEGLSQGRSHELTPSAHEAEIRIHCRSRPSQGDRGPVDGVARIMPRFTTRRLTQPRREMRRVMTRRGAASRRRDRQPRHETDTA